MFRKKCVLKNFTKFTGNVKKNNEKLMKIVNTERENLHIF